MLVATKIMFLQATYSQTVVREPNAHQCRTGYLSKFEPASSRISCRLWRPSEVQLQAFAQIKACGRPGANLKSTYPMWRPSKRGLFCWLKVVMCRPNTRHDLCGLWALLRHSVGKRKGFASCRTRTGWWWDHLPSLYLQAL